MSEDEPSETTAEGVDGDDAEMRVQDETDTPDPVAGFSTDDDAATASSGTGESDAASPFDELASEMESDSDDVDQLFDELFTEAGTNEMDTESVWRELEETAEGSMQGDPEETSAGSIRGDPEETSAGSVWSDSEETTAGNRDVDGDGSVVPTISFCAQCEHVADPPEVRCTYEGSEIVEFVDEDHVRVRNCPIVAQREQISEMD